MNIIFDEASKDDIAELIRLRIAYMIDDFGGIGEYEKECMEKQLPDYFNRKLGDELIAFIARDGQRIVSVMYLQIIEMPANSILPNGLYGEVLSVYTEPEYRGKGLCTKLMKNLLSYGKERGLGRVDLSATDAGYPIYKKAGFTDKEHRYKDMRYRY
ncbi:MAG: GNAT family N-acetyltransferase [Lachnospiraceae bacterium]